MPARWAGPSIDASAGGFWRLPHELRAHHLAAALAFPRPDRGGHRALANAPEVLLLDEPTAALDPDAGERIVALLRDLRARGLSLVMVTHVEAHARALRGTLYRCERGRIRADA